MSTTIGSYEARTRFSELLARVEAGDEVIITRHGVPIAHLSPVRPQATVEQKRQAIKEMKNLARSNSLKGLKIKDLINEGRR